MNNTKNSITKKDLESLAKKYNISHEGTKNQIAQRLCDLRGIYLSQTERKKILPLLNKNLKNTKLLISFYNQSIRKNMPN